MGSLTTCIKKAGGALVQEDKTAILERSKSLRDEGKNSIDAARQAVEEQLSAVQAALGGASPLSAVASTPSGNTVFTDAAADAARARLRGKLGTLNSGVDPEMLIDGITLAGYHIEKGARSFAAFSSAMLGDLGDAVRPYLKSWYMAARYDPRLSAMASGMSSSVEVESADVDTIKANTGETNASSADGNMERDRGDSDAEDASVERDFPDAAREDGAGDRGLGDDFAEERGRPANDPGVSADRAAASGERGDQPMDRAKREDGPAEFDAGPNLDQRSADSGKPGVQTDPVATEQVARAADSLGDNARRLQAQRAAESLTIEPGLENIRATLPYLLPEQQEDVAKAETRFSKPDGYGMLFTNGTGTGKTFTALGVIKRFSRQGKNNQLVLVPDNKIMQDWIDSAKSLGLALTPLKDTKDAGAGLVITTYSNAQDNLALVGREWDLVTADEAHQLMQGKDGKPTGALATLQSITRHPSHSYKRFLQIHAEDIAKQKELRLTPATAESRALDAKLNAAAEAVKEDVVAKQGAARTRALFMSATPFAYEFTVDWAEGYLFDYGKELDGSSGRYNMPDRREAFFISHFGYRMRTGKLTAPDVNVDSGLMQRQFNGWLKKQGSLAGRTLQVEKDYDRKFVLVDSAIGNRIDAALDWLSTEADAERDVKEKADGPKGMQALSKAVSDSLYGEGGHLIRRYLLEAIKAKESIDIIKRHLALGRKVVVFHDFKKGGAQNPFAIPARSPGGVDGVSADEARDFNNALSRFNKEFADLTDGGSLKELISPVERLKKAFPDVLLINGDEKPRDLLKRYKRFNDDAQGPIVALVQSAKNKGWSGHDTTGKYPRVLFNLGLPTQPTMVIQQEGRIYRVGQASDAMFRYLNTGTTWERWAFAQTIARRAGAAENLGQGEYARALLDSFISGYEESDAYPPGHDGEGKGGKERDKAMANAITEYDRAKSFYYGTQKKNSRTKAQEGVDYFATPEPVGLKMVQWLDLRGGESALEPSAGHGAIARWLPDSIVRTAIEPSMQLRARLALSFDGKIIGERFEDHHVVNKYDGIVLNPPFGSGGRTAVDHIAKAALHLKEGGRIVALLPSGPSADAKFDKWFYEEQQRPVKPIGTLLVDGKETPIYKGDTVQSRAAWAPEGVVTRWSDGALMVKATAPEFRGAVTSISRESIKSVNATGERSQSFRAAEGLSLIASIDLPRVAFEHAGTAVATRILVLEKVSAGGAKGGAQALPRQLDFSRESSVNSLFDALENVTLPLRSGAQLEVTEPKASRGKAASKAGASPEAGGQTVVEHTTQKGKLIKGVIRADLTKDQAQSIDLYTWKKNGGYFIRVEHLDKLNKAFPPPTLSGEALETRGGLASPLWRGSEFDDASPATSQQAYKDAVDVLGFDPAIRVMRESRPEHRHVPMRYSLGDKTVYYNTAAPHGRALDVQMMVEELMHAVDHVDGDKIISAGSARFNPEGDMRLEIQAARKKSSVVNQFFAYPLDEPNFSQDRIAAELFARAGVLYHGHPELLKATAPNVFDIYQRLLGRANRDSSVPSQIRGGQLFVRDAEVRGEPLGVGRSVLADEQSGTRLEAGGLQRLREQVGRELGADSKGSEFVGGDLSSRMGQALSSLDIRNAKLLGGKIVSDHFGKTLGNLHWWHKSVGTPYNLAQLSKPYSKVYDTLQSFLHDISTYAARSGDLAPNIIPKLSSITEIFKSPLPARDSLAVAKPVFDGTLYWRRDAQGKPVLVESLRQQAALMPIDDKAHALLRAGVLSPKVLKMWQGLPMDQYEAIITGKYERDMLKPGIVWKDDELRSLFKATDKQVKLYREFRRATDQSIDDLAVSAILRLGRKDLDPDFRKELLEERDLQAPAEAVRDSLWEAVANSTDEEYKARLNAMADKVIDVADRAEDLKLAGYAPLMRFGDLTLDIVDASGKRVFFGMYESNSDRKKAFRDVTAAFPGATIKQGTVSTEEFKRFAGVTPETLELFGDAIGLSDELTKDAVFQEYLQKAIANRSGMKRLIHRKGIEGYSTDAGRVLASFIYSNARQISTNLHAGQAQAAMDEIPREQGQLRDYAQKQIDYVQNPSEEVQWAKSLMFTQFLGGSVASAMVNMTQPFMVTLPELAAHSIKAPAFFAKALANVGRRSFAKEPGLDAAMKRAAQDGTIEPQEVFHLQAQSAGKGSLKSGDGTLAGNAGAVASNFHSRVMLAWGKPFSYAEMFNRRVTFIAAYRLAASKGNADPYQFAANMVDRTQFVYNRANRSQWGRGPVGGILMTFKTYAVSMMETLARSAKTKEGRRTFALMLLMVVLMAGIDGLPFMEDMEDVIDGFAQRVLDLNWSTRAWRNEQIATVAMRIFGEAAGVPLAQFLSRGVTGLAGAPFDVSSRLGLHNLVPGTGLFLKKKSHGNDTAELLGPAGSLVKRFYEAAEQIAQGDVRNGLMHAMPNAAQNVGKAVEMTRSGYYPDTKGNMVIKTDGVDATFKGLGFQPSNVARAQRIVGNVTKKVGLATQVKEEILQDAAKALNKGDKEGQDAAFKRLEAWNKRNPETPIDLKPRGVIKRAQKMTTEKEVRMIKNAPKSMRGFVSEAFDQLETQE